MFRLNYANAHYYFNFQQLQRSLCKFAKVEGEYYNVDLDQKFSFTMPRFKMQKQGNSPLILYLRLLSKLNFPDLVHTGIVIYKNPIKKKRSRISIILSKIFLQTFSKFMNKLNIKFSLSIIAYTKKFNAVNRKSALWPRVLWQVCRLFFIIGALL